MKIIKDENGGSLVEFVLIAPLLFLILFGIIEFGLVLYNQAVLTNASREGARYAILSRTPRYTDAEIRSTVVSDCAGLITFGTNTAPSVAVARLDGTTLFGDDLEVRVTWSYNFLVLPNFAIAGLTNPLPLRARTVMKYE